MLVGTALMIFNRDQILLAKRRDGRYGLAGGKMNDDESLTTCIQRETLEETGLANLDITPTGFVTSHSGYVCVWFYAYHSRQAILYQEYDELGPKAEPWQWYNIKKLPDPLMPGIVEAIQHYFAHRDFIRLEHFDGN